MSFIIKDKATREWVQLHKKLYLTSKEQVLNKLGSSHAILKPLEVKYKKELSKGWSPTKLEIMIDEILQQKTELILLGDFHALQQSQRGHLRIIREVIKKNRNHRPLILGAEFLKAKDQKWIDLFLQKKISEKIFLKKIKWEQSWGFPWSHYLPLLEFARENNIKVIGLNWSFKEKKLSSLKSRENYSVLRLKKVKQIYPDSLIFIIYGELHLLKEQLPHSFEKLLNINKNSIVRIFQNFEPIYFKLTQQGLESQIEYLKMSRNNYCILNVPPWVKWQSYLMHLENKLDTEWDEFSLDLTDHLAKQIQFLSSILKIKVSIDEISVYTVGDESFFYKLKELGAKEYHFVKKLISLEKSFFHSKLQAGYLARMDINQMSSLASEYVHGKLSHRNFDYLEIEMQFIKLIWLQSVKYFGSKLINHKRKTSTLEDIRSSLHMSKSKNKRKILMMVLRQKMYEVAIIRSRFQKTNPLKFKSKLSGSSVDIWEAARLLGEMLGDKLFIYFRKNKMKQEQLKSIFTQTLFDPEFEEYYYSWILKLN